MSTAGAMWITASLKQSKVSFRCVMVHQQHCSLADNTAVNLKGGGPWWQMDGISYAEVTAILEVL